MSEEKTELPVEEEIQAPAEGAGPNVGDELQELGRHLTDATRAILESPEAKEMGAQLQRGLESLQGAVNQLLGQARETKVGKTVESGVSEAATSVKDRRVLETLGESVATALNTVNRSLGQAVEKVEARAKEAEKSAPQQIEIVAGEEEAPDEPEAGQE